MKIKRKKERKKTAKVGRQARYRHGSYIYGIYVYTMVDAKYARYRQVW